MPILKSHSETIDLSVNEVANWIKEDLALNESNTTVSFTKKDISGYQDRYSRYEVTGVNVISKMNSVRGVEEKEWEFKLDEVNNLIKSKITKWFSRPLKQIDVSYPMVDISDDRLGGSPSYDVTKVKVKVYF